ncbi:MAG TPA: hypothetical protein VIV61_07375 [Candidatus Ozemobacteraceae bacterium]
MMDCREFKARLETEESLSVPAALKEHAAQCHGCARLLAAQERLRIGIEINRRAVCPPDLSSRIMERIARQNPETTGEPGLFERLVLLLSPSTPVRSMLYYGTAGIIIFALCHAVIERSVELRRQKLSPGWTLTSTRGPLSLPAGTAIGSRLPADTVITCGNDGEGQLIYGSFCRIRLYSARATLASAGIRLESGTLDAELARKPGDAQIQFSTPHAEIVDIGTHFSVTVADGSSSVVLHDGRLRVTASADRESREMVVPGRLTILPAGFQKPDVPAPATPASSPASPEFHRQQAPEE